MQTRCKPGDIAVILYDEPSCLLNVGRLVRIHPTLKLNPSYQLECWLIEPLDPAPWAVSKVDGTVYTKPIGLADEIEHPDAWMLPIKDEQGFNVMTQEEVDAYDRIQKRIDESLVEMGAVDKNMHPVV